MDPHRFDTIAKALATPRPRRAVLRALLGAAGVAALGARGAAAAPGELCHTHLECPGKQLCQFDDATETRRCTTLEGLDPSELRICKGEFEHTYCQRGSICCVSPGIRDTGGGPVLELVPNCCDDGLVCDREAGCVLPPGRR
jgi:hypothetical protein